MMPRASAPNPDFVPAHVERAQFPPAAAQVRTSKAGIAARVWLASACIPALLALGLAVL